MEHHPGLDYEVILNGADAAWLVSLLAQLAPSEQRDRVLDRVRTADWHDEYRDWPGDET